MEKRNGYSFKRAFYYDAEIAVKKNKITFVLGPRKCGKTVCLHQLEEELKKTVYLDMKSETDIKPADMVKQIVADIAANVDVIYLIDEATYMPFPDKSIARIAGAFSEYDNSNTRVVFSGSQSKALEFWGHIACGGNAAFIKTGFLSYPEWLAFKGLTEVSERTYRDFLFNSREFYKDFSNTKEYLQGCLDETVISNKKSAECVVDNEVENLTAEMLLDVLYASLVKLHNHTSYENFANQQLLTESIEFYFWDELTAEEKERVRDILNGRYRNFKSMDSYDCKMAMQFLSNCGLTTLTYVSDELTADPYIVEKLLKDTSELHTKTQLFSRFNLTIDYPMFFVDLVKEILKDRKIEEIPKEMLGSIVECHVRSLLPQTGAFEYRSSTGKEIDYISNSGLALEISVSNKRLRDVNLNILPETYKKILLTKEYSDEVNNIQRIPYYRFIYEKSPGKELITKNKTKDI